MDSDNDDNAEIRLGKSTFRVEDLILRKDYDCLEIRSNDTLHPTIYRDIVYQSSPNWIYTVDITRILDHDGIYTGKENVNIIRWKRKIDKTTCNKKTATRYWQFVKAYNISSKEEWIKTSSVVNAILGRADKRDTSTFITKTEKEEYAITREINKELLNEIEVLKKRYNKRRLEKAFYKDRYLEFKNNIANHKQFLNGFKEKLDSRETDIHVFIKKSKAYWLFGPDYMDMNSKFNVLNEDKKTIAYQFDLLLQRVDLFYDIVELKGPNVNLFDRRTSNRYKPNQDLAEAIGQVIKYLYICDTYLKGIFKPKAIIVIGNSETDNPEERRLLSSYLSNIEIITYSDLYKRGMSFIEYIEKPNNNFSEN